MNTGNTSNTGNASNTSGNAGALFRNTMSQNPRAPQLTGVLNPSAALIAELYRRSKNDQPTQLRVAGWRNQAKTSGIKYITLAISLPDLPREASDNDDDDRKDPLDL